MDPAAPPLLDAPPAAAPPVPPAPPEPGDPPEPGTPPEPGIAVTPPLPMPMPPEPDAGRSAPASTGGTLVAPEPEQEEPSAPARNRAMSRRARPAWLLRPTTSEANTAAAPRVEGSRLEISAQREPKPLAQRAVVLVGHGLRRRLLHRWSGQ